MTISTALGLLAHIQVVLLFPAWLLILYFKKPRSFLPFIVFLIPALVVFYSVFVLNLNDFSSVFFDNVQEKMTSPGWINILKGPFFIAGISIAIMPFYFLIQTYSSIRNSAFWKEIVSDKWVLILFSILIPVFGFASLFPERGIHVFLLPGFLVLAILGGYQFSKLPFSNILSLSFPIIQVGFFFLFQVGYDLLQKSRNPVLELKGGSSYLFQPWAKGNASSVIDIAKNLPLDSLPEDLHWNVGQAKDWLKASEKRN
jgi:hypothetical protein